MFRGTYWLLLKLSLENSPVEEFLLELPTGMLMMEKMIVL
jgi:hypothetical protein